MISIKSGYPILNYPINSLPMNNKIKEFFEKNPGKTLVNYYQQRAAKISSSNSEISNTYFHLPEPVVENRDFVTSVNRVKYAAHHWDEFKNFNSETLSRFEIDWYPNPDLKGCNSIEKRCQQLKNQYKSRCNQEYGTPQL